MTTLIHNQPSKVELAMAVSMWLGLCDRERQYAAGSKRKEDCAQAAIETAIAGSEKFGWDAWTEALNKMVDQFPDHDWSTGHSQQVVWFAQHQA